MSDANPCISVSGRPGRSLPGRIKGEKGSGQTGKRKPIASEKRWVQPGSSLLLSYAAVWFQILACGVGCLLFLDSLSQYFSLHYIFEFQGYLGTKRGCLYIGKRVFSSPVRCVAVSFQDFSRVSAPLSTAQPRAASPPSWLAPWSRVCVWGREESASRIAFLVFQRLL